MRDELLVRFILDDENPSNPSVKERTTRWLHSNVKLGFGCPNLAFKRADFQYLNT